MRSGRCCGGHGNKTAPCSWEWRKEGQQQTNTPMIIDRVFRTLVSLLNELFNLSFRCFTAALAGLDMLNVALLHWYPSDLLLRYGGRFECKWQSLWRLGCRSWLEMKWWTVSAVLKLASHCSAHFSQVSFFMTETLMPNSAAQEWMR